MAKTRKDPLVSYKEKYDPLWAAMMPVPKKQYSELVQLCQKNVWLRIHGIPFADDPCLEEDSPYTFCEISDLDVLALFFEHGNWAIRQGVLHQDLFFCNQVNGGDEWWTCRYDNSAQKWVPFESITFRPMVRNGEFRQFLSRLSAATIEQCVSLCY